MPSVALWENGLTIQLTPVNGTRSFVALEHASIGGDCALKRMEFSGLREQS